MDTAQRDAGGRLRAVRGWLAAAGLIPLQVLAAPLAARSDPRPARSAREFWGRLDLALAGNIALALIVFTGSMSELAEQLEVEGEGTPLLPGQWLLALALGAALVLRNRWPLVAWRVAAASMVLTWIAYAAILSVPGSVTGVFAYLLCCYTAAKRNPWRTSLGVAVVTVVALVVLPFNSTFQDPGGAIVYAYETGLVRAGE